MNKMILSIVAGVLASSVASADVIRCIFTEPFIDTTYSMSQQSLTIEEAGGKPRTIKNVSFQIMGPGRFNLVAKNGKVLQELTLNNNGSDGMSDAVYPYEVKDFTMSSGANNGIGGCSSNYLKSKNESEK